MKRLFPIAIAAVAVLVSCHSKFYEECPSDRIFGDWGVVNHTHTFGEYDSLYYIVNPIGNINDTVYYNGNYTDSYYHSDPIRVMMRYTVQDSIIFNIDRLYSVQINPPAIRLTVKERMDTTETVCRLLLKKYEGSDHLYKCGPDSVFTRMLAGGHELEITGTNASLSGEPAGSQNYEFYIYTRGFSKAQNLAKKLNPGHKVPKDSLHDKTKNSKKNIFDKL